VGVGGLIPALNGKAGVATTHLGIANLPAHNHAAWTGAAGAHNHQLLDKNNTTPLKWSSQGPDLKHPASQESPGGYRNSGIAIVSSVAGHTHAVGVGNTGSGAGFTNMQPSIGLNFVISV
jgi:microcystin-dependent protein